MKVVFFARGNKKVDPISPFTRTQYNSLLSENLDLSLLPVTGKGWKSYVRGIRNLRRLIRQERPNIIHAQYSVCGYAAAMAAMFTQTKVVVSILGSFPKNNFKLHLVRFCIRHVWDKTCVQSAIVARQLAIDLPIIPTGINIEQFHPMEQGEARRHCGFDNDKKYVIWCSHPQRPEKDFALAEQSIESLHRDDVVLVPVFDRAHDEVVKYMCAADVMFLSSHCEGSPNVVKEAMTCNCPIVTTDVGDVAWVTGNTEGTFVSQSRDPKYIASLIEKAIAYGKRTRGRERIIEIGLTTTDIAKKLMQLYHSTLDIQ